MKTVEITVKSGIIQDICLPADIQARVYDADEDIIHLHHADGSVSIESAKIRAVRQSMNILKYLRQKGTVSMNSSEFREIAAKMKAKKEDFQINRFRFVHANAIDRIITQELENDAYQVGFFGSAFLLEITDFPIEAINILQNVGAYETLGRLIIDSGHLPALVEAYVEEDGYGKHFACYDDYSYNCGSYYMFQIN